MPQITMEILEIGEESLAIRLAEIFYEKSLSVEKASVLLASESSRLLSAQLEDEIIGFCFFHLLPRWYDQEPELFLYDLEILPPYRRKGYGRQLFEAVVAFAREKNIPEIWLLTDDSYQEAVPFYKALGGEVEAALLVSFPDAWD